MREGEKENQTKQGKKNLKHCSRNNFSMFNIYAFMETIFIYT